MEECSVGEVTLSACHLLNYVQKIALQPTEVLSENDLTLLKLRNESSSELKTICLHHQSVLLKKYELLQKICCDPFKKHKSSIYKTLCAVTVEQKESLQRHLDKQILTTNHLFVFCKNNISNIKFEYISKEAVDSTRLNLESRFKDVRTLPGTRSFHSFQPVNEFGMIEARRIISDETPAFTFNLCNKQQTSSVKMENLYPGCFIACIYDNLWYFGMVSEVNGDDDVIIKFLHPHGPSVSFFWPQREDVCAVPIPHLIAIVEPPKTMTGRTYQFSQECMMYVQSSFENSAEIKSSSTS